MNQKLLLVSDWLRAALAAPCAWRKPAHATPSTMASSCASTVVVSSDGEEEVVDAHFRLQATHLALTWPKCNILPVDAIVLLQERMPSRIASVLVVRELHKDGDVHLHAYVRLNARCFFGNCHFADLNSFHGEYYNCKRRMEKNGGGGGAQGWCRYIMKDKPTGENIAVYKLDVDAMIAKKGCQYARVAGMMLDGSTPAEILDEEPGFVLRCGRQVDDFYSRVCTARAEHARLTWPGESESFRVETVDDRDGDDGTLLETALNLIVDPRNCGMARRHIWIGGPTGVGKTRFALWLSKYCNTVWVSPEPVYFLDGYSRNTEVLIFDEFACQYRCAFVNALMSGSTPVNRKGLPLLAPSADHSPLCLFLANFPEQDSYRNVETCVSIAFSARIACSVWFADKFTVTVADGYTEV